MVSRLRALWRLFVYLGIMTPLCMVFQGTALRLNLPVSRTFPLWFHRQVCRVVGVQIERRGRQSRVHPTLYVANHVSYLDIEVMGALIKGSFVAKAEIAKWPIFGTMARLQRSIFVERKPHRTGAARDEMLKRLEAGENLMLFAEGTSGDGTHVLPFKSALFAAAEVRPQGKPLTVQAVSITYARLDGLPMGRYLRPYFAWYGDMDMASHGWNIFGLGKIGVIVEFHKPVTIDEFPNRKALAEHCQAQVMRGVSNALSGRPRRAVERPAPGMPPARPSGSPPAGSAPSGPTAAGPTAAGPAAAGPAAAGAA